MSQDIPEIPLDLFEDPEESSPPAEKPARKPAKGQGGKARPQAPGRAKKPKKPRKARKRRRPGGVPLWAWALLLLGWALTCSVLGVVAWRLRASVLAPPPPPALPTTPAAALTPTAPEALAGAPSPSPSPTNTPTSTVSPAPSATPSPTSQVTSGPAAPQLPPTEVEWKPTETPTPQATATATATPSPTPPPPTPTPTPIVTGTPVPGTGTPVASPSPTPVPPPPETEYTLLIPLYIYPSAENLASWQQVAQARSQINVIAIINPNNGPGGPPNADYQKAMNLLKQAGVTLVGYVPTGYGKRLSEAIRADISMYDTYFPQIDGIFFDEVPTDPAYLNKYQSLEGYAKSFFDGPIIFNPGTVPDALYFEFGDIWVLFEDIPSAWQNFALPDAIAGERVAVLVHTAAVGEMRRIVRDIRNQGLAGYVYITDDREPNPWDTLPSYFDEEIQRLLGQTP